MTINLQTGGYTPPQSLPGARSADTQVVQKQQVKNTEITVPMPGQTAPEGVPAAEKDRYEQIFFASKSMFKDVYPVGDKSFTIFKDATGQYITRYTSLRDGRVTYIPELKMLQMFESSQRSRRPVIEIQA